MSVEKSINKYYNDINEDERFNMRSKNIEFIVTKKYIDKYLKQGDKILEIGAGTGRYSLYYADKGYTVNAIELVEKNLEELKRKINSKHNIRAIQGNALDLSMYEDNSFDVTLVLGPMYHLFTKEDKLKALSEATRVTKNNGILFVAYIQFDAAIIQAGFIKGMFDFLAENKMLDNEKYLPISNKKAVF
ncbi:MAG: class I SAM-dependent methyltransferase [Lachnospiraceae bacterium]